MRPEREARAAMMPGGQCDATLQWISTDSRSPSKEGLPPTKRRGWQLEMKTPRALVCRKDSEGALSDSGESLTVQGSVSLSPRFAQSMVMIPLIQLFCSLTGFSYFFWLTPKGPGSKTFQTFME